jgi:uncharacterized protein (TIGR02594 family)
MSTLLEEMRASIGVHETAGPDSNPEIVAYFADCGWKLSELGEDSTVAWCAARMGSALKRCGYPIPPKANNLTARTYTTYGVGCDPQPGAIGIIPRGTSGWQGHVFLIEQVLPDGRWQTIGGNQGALGEVSRAIIDPRKTEVLAVRKPIEATVEALRPHSSEIKTADKLETSSWLGLLASSATAAIGKLLAPVDVPDMSLPEALDWYGLVLKSGGALVKLVVDAPWLAGAALTCLVCILVARQWKRARVQKHEIGIPISAEIKEAV